MISMPRYTRFAFYVWSKGFSDFEKGLRYAFRLEFDMSRLV